MVFTFLWLGPDLAPYRLRFAGLLALFILLPGLAYKRRHLVEARDAVSHMWAFGQLHFSEVSQMLEASNVLQADIKDSKPYIDVMHEQIGDSLSESEGEVLKVIEQIGLLHAKASQQRERIAESIKSGKELNESTNIRIENNKQIIAAIEMQLDAQNEEFMSNFERIEEWPEKLARWRRWSRSSLPSHNRPACWL